MHYIFLYWESWKKHNILSHLMTKPSKMACAPSSDSDQTRAESLLCAWRKLGSLAIYWGHEEDTKNMCDMENGGDLEKNKCKSLGSATITSWSQSLTPRERGKRHKPTFVKQTHKNTQTSSLFPKRDDRNVKRTEKKKKKKKKKKKTKTKSKARLNINQLVEYTTDSS